MYTRCLLCRSPFVPNKRLQNLSLGTGVAYDIQRGRLWQICSGCRRWSLVPLAQRWEALEELEALVASGKTGGRPVRLLSSTSQVSLFEAGDLRIVRVGAPAFAEEAWWRFGETPGGVSILEARLPKPSRWERRGKLAWRGEKSCPGCGHRFTELPFADRKLLVLGPPEGDGPPALIRRCPRCRETHHGGLRLTGTEAELTLARILAFEDRVGASLDRVKTAARLIQDPDGPGTLIRLLSRYGQALGDMPPVGILALEMTTMAVREARLLKLEAEELRFRWRQEEELAALIDGDLTPQPLLDRLIRRIRGGSLLLLG